MGPAVDSSKAIAKLCHLLQLCNFFCQFMRLFLKNNSKNVLSIGVELIPAFIFNGVFIENYINCHIFAIWIWGNMAVCNDSL